MIGTLINTATVTAGALLGLGLKTKLPERLTSIVFQVLGLFTTLIGVMMALETGNPLVMVLAALFGALLGEALALERRLETLADRWKGSAAQDGKRFVQGFVTAFVLFCVGAMTLVGCFQEGITGDRRLIVTKSIMDFFSSTALAAAFGRGVLFTAIPLLVYQGGLTLMASAISPWITAEMMHEITAVGGLMMLGLGLNILEIQRIRVVNLLPALFFAALFAYLASQWGVYALPTVDLAQ